MKISNDIKTILEDHHLMLSPEIISKLKKIQIEAEKNDEFVNESMSVMKEMEQLNMSILKRLHMKGYTMSSENRISFDKILARYHGLIFTMISSTHDTGLDDVTEPTINTSSTLIISIYPSIFPVSPNLALFSCAVNSFTKNDSPPKAAALSDLRNPPFLILVSVLMLPLMYTIAAASAVTFSPWFRVNSINPIGFFRIS